MAVIIAFLCSFPLFYLRRERGCAAVFVISSSVFRLTVHYLYQDVNHDNQMDTWIRIQHSWVAVTQTYDKIMFHLLICFYALHQKA